MLYDTSLHQNRLYLVELLSYQSYRNAQKAAKRVIKEIYRQNKEFNKEEQYLTLFQYTFGYNTQNMPIAFEKQTSDVYTVKETTR